MRSLSDDELLRRLDEAIRDSRRIDADLIALIAEVDARRLYAREATPSMFAHCTEVLHLSEPEAILRIRVARASRKHPVLLTMLRNGGLHMSGIALLAPLLTRGNRATLLKRATRRSKRQIEEMVAELQPRPETPAMMRSLPAGPNSAPSLASVALCPDTVRPGNSLVGCEMAEVLPQSLLCPDTGAAAPGRSATMEPVARDRFRVHFTASRELRHKLERLQDLMRSSVLDGDLGAIIEAAVSEKLERLEAKRFGKTKAPRKTLAETDTTPTSRDIPAAVRRAVYERDRGQCTYEDARGKRCKATERLEFHHHETPYGHEGDHSVDNVRLMCRAHNELLAEQVYGKEKMARFRRSKGKVAGVRTVGRAGRRSARDSRGLSPPSP